MKTKVEEEKDVGAVDLSHYMQWVIGVLSREHKYPAVHTYRSTLRSFRAFSGGGAEALPMSEVFTQGRLKEYEEWLMQRMLCLDTVSTYMRTLRAVYNRWAVPGTAGHNPKLFDDVYTKVSSHTKRALTERQFGKLMYADTQRLSEEQRCVLAYFLLMFLFRGMPFIDLAYLRKKDVQGNTIVYRRHKTGRQLTIHIPKEALPLINGCKNRNCDSIYLFPILDGQAKNSGWNLYRFYQAALRSFNRMLRRVAKILLPGVKVSSYTARHTWATLAFHIGMPVGIISQSLGHSSIKVTETYLKPFENELVDKANRELISSVRKSKKRDDLMRNRL